MQDDSNIKIYSHFLSEISPLIKDFSFVQRYFGSELSKKECNPLLTRGSKVFSQADEDGITFEILRRIGLTKGVFAEFGVGNGTENNTLALAAAGWSGFWFGGEDLAFDFNPKKSNSLNFYFEKNWITRENIFSLYQEGLFRVRQNKCNLISIDLDGNDLYLAEEILKFCEPPDVFIFEYNAKFIPPIRFSIDYDPNHVWRSDDYYGASLASFCDLLEKNDYFLACCSLCGTNAFFVANKWKSQFQDIPTDVFDLYQPPSYWMAKYFTSGNQISKNTLYKIMSSLNP